AGERKIIVRLARTEKRGESAQEAPASAVPLETEESATPKNEESPRPPSRRPNRQPRAPRSSQRGGSSPRKSSNRPRRDDSISNSRGYEIYPRDSKGGFSSEPTPGSAATTPPVSAESSPYFDDHGDFENRGNRRPRSRRR